MRICTLLQEGASAMLTVPICAVHCREGFAPYHRSSGGLVLLSFIGMLHFATRPALHGLEFVLSCVERNHHTPANPNESTNMHSMCLKIMEFSINPNAKMKAFQMKYQNQSHY